MNRDDLLDLFRRCSALLDGHFRLSSGLHSPGYLQCALVLRPATVLSPALGGLIIGHEVARALGARAIFAEREDGVLRLRRGFTLTEAERVLVVEDVLTTGGSTRETMQVARAAGAQVLAAAAIVDRSGGTSSLDVPLHSLVSLSLPTYEPAACPLCAQGVPLTKPGSRQVAAG